MVQKNSLRLAAFIALGGLLVVAGPDPIPAQTPASSAREQQAAAEKEAPKAPDSYQLEPRAIEVLKAVGNRLAAAKTMSFVAVETFEQLSRQGAPLAFAHRSEVTLHRPNKLRVIKTADGPVTEFYYDGKTMMAFAPAENTVAIMDAPPTIDAALKAIHDAAATYFPFTDLIVADPYGDLRPGLKHAYYVGQSHVIGDTTTDIVAFNGDGVFVQMWVGAEDKLPRLMHAIFLNDPDELRHNLVLSDWKLDAPVSADHFTSPRIAGAKRIGFAHPAKAQPPAAAKPSSSSPPSQ